MASEVIKLNLIPKGEMPVFHASQFDTGRLITCELYRGEDAYSVPEGYTVELHCRKVDNNIVTMASTLINDNVVTFTSTEQLTACNGNNLCEVAILDEGYRIGTLNFILEVEIDPLKGGITSTSEIHNLESQVEEITTEIIGENYYDKSEVDDLLSAKADSDSVYTIGEVNTLLSGKANASDVYTKTQTDTLLNAKADVSDLPDMTDYYTKTATDALLDDKANAVDVYTKEQTDTLLNAKADASTVTAALATKADKSDTYTKEQVDDIIYNIFPVKTSSGVIAQFDTGLSYPLVSVTAAEDATSIIRHGVNFWDEEWEIVNGRVTSKNFIKVIPGVQYFFYNTNLYDVTMYDDEFNSLGHPSYGVRPGGYVFNTSADCAYIKFDLGTPYGNVYNHDVSVLYPATNTTYTPYNGVTKTVAEADTIRTIQGTNFVFADVGEVTVQYKYMSM